MTTILQKDGEILENKISSIDDFFQLMKPRVMSLVIFTALIGYFCGVFSSEIILNPYLVLVHLEFLISGMIRTLTQLWKELKIVLFQKEKLNHQMH